MHSPIPVLLRALRRLMLSLLVIASILAAGGFLLEQGQSWRHASADLATLARTSDAVDVAKVRLAAAAQQRVAQANLQSQAQLDGWIAQLRQTLAAQPAEGGLLTVPLQGADQVAQRLIARYEHRVDMEITRQLLDHLLKLRALLDDPQRRRAALVLDLHNADAALLQETLAIRGLSPVEKLRFRLLPDSLRGSSLSALRQRFKSAYAMRLHILAALNSADGTLQASLAGLRRRPPFVPDQAAIDGVTADLALQLTAVRDSGGANWVTRYGMPLVRKVPAALGILGGAWVLHLIIKLLFFYVLAPLAGRCKPVVLSAYLSRLESLLPRLASGGGVVRRCMASHAASSRLARACQSSPSASSPLLR